MSCSLCSDVSIISCSNSHNSCKNCLESYLKVLSSQNIEEIKKRNGKISCFGDSCSCVLDETDVAKNVSSEIFHGYISSLKGYLINEELNKKVTENEVEKANNIIADILNSKCPKCSQVWFSSDACMAVECSKCGVKFCGFCCEKTFMERQEHHNHVQDCELNPRKGDYFCSQELLKGVVLKRNNKVIENYLSFLKTYVSNEIYEKIIELDILKTFMYDKYYQEIIETKSNDEIYEKSLAFLIRYNKNINDKFITIFSRYEKKNINYNLAHLMLARNDLRLFFFCLEQGANIDLIPNFFEKFIGIETSIRSLENLYKFIDVNKLPSNYHSLECFSETFEDYFISTEYSYNFRNNIPIKFYIEDHEDDIFNFNSRIIFQNKPEDYNNPDFQSVNTLVLLSMTSKKPENLITFFHLFKDKILYDEDILINLKKHQPQFNFMIDYYLNTDNEDIIYELFNNLIILFFINEKYRDLLIEKIQPDQINGYVLENSLGLFSRSMFLKLLRKCSHSCIDNNLTIILNDKTKTEFSFSNVLFYESVIKVCLNKHIWETSILSEIPFINNLEILKAIYNVIGKFEEYSYYYKLINDEVFFKILNLELKDNFLGLFKNNQSLINNNNNTNEKFNEIMKNFKGEIISYFLQNFEPNENTKKRKFVVFEETDKINVEETIKISVDSDIDTIENISDDELE